MTIKKLQQLKLSAVQPEALQTAVKDLLSDYDETSDKKAFEDIAKENIEKVFLLVERLAPDAIVKVKKEAKKEVKKKATPKVKAPTKTVKKELDKMTSDIQLCRSKIRKFNEEKRKGQPKKPKPMRHTKIKGHFLSIANLIPPKLKDDVSVQKEAEKILIRAHRSIMNAYKMNFVSTEKGVEEIKEKFDKMEEKATT